MIFILLQECWRWCAYMLCFIWYRSFVLFVTLEPMPPFILLPACHLKSFTLAWDCPFDYDSKIAVISPVLMYLNRIQLIKNDSRRLYSYHFSSGWEKWCGLKNSSERSAVKELNPSCMCVVPQRKYWSMLSEVRPYCLKYCLRKHSILGVQ